MYPKKNISNESCICCHKSRNCIKCFFCFNCWGCEYLANCSNMRNCSHCVNCDGLDNRSYYVDNRKVTKEEFQKAWEREAIVF